MLHWRGARPRPARGRDEVVFAGAAHSAPIGGPARRSTFPRRRPTDPPRCSEGAQHPCSPPAAGRARLGAPRRCSPRFRVAGRCSERAADNFLPGARRRGASRCPHLTPLRADRSDARGDAAGALLRPWRGDHQLRTKCERHCDRPNRPNSAKCDRNKETFGLTRNLRNLKESRKISFFY